MWGMAGVDVKTLQKQLLGRGHHGSNDPRERGPSQSLCSSHKKKQGSDMLLRHSANWGTSAPRTSSQSFHHGNERTIKKEDQTLRPELCEES